MVKKVITSLIIFAIAILTNGILLKYSWAANGTYISTNIGEETATSFTSFKALDQTIPANTSITYQFASNNDDYEVWSNEQACIDVIDLTKIANLANSKYVKVKINLYSSISNSPNLSGFEVIYQTTTNSSTNQSTSTANQVSNAINVKTSADFTASSTSQSSSNSSSASSVSNSTNNSNTNSNSSTNTNTKTVSLSQNKNEQINLVSTGGSLWVNIVIALAITGALSLLLFYHNIRFVDKNNIKY